MKIKDIVKEGYWSTLAKELLPKGLRAAVDPNKPSTYIDDYKAAEKAYELFGMADMPDMTAAEFEKQIAKLPPKKAAQARRAKGIQSWLTDQQRKRAEVEIDMADEENKKAEELAAQTAQAAKLAALEPDIPNVLGTKTKPTQTTPAMTAAPSSTIAGKIRPAVSTVPPPQVKLPSGEYITKYGGSWYNEKGQQVADPGSIASLERRAQKPSGQAQMATTKNIPVQLPGYKGKRR